MKHLLLFFFVALGSFANAQITLEHVYDSASVVMVGGTWSQLMVIHFELSGDHYLNINRLAKKVNIYDMNHALVESIDCSTFPLSNNGNRLGDFLYFSETLFDTDPGIEFMYTSNFGNADQFTRIYNSDGSTIFADSGAPLVIINVPQQQRPVYNTSNGTKMLLSYMDGSAKVYGLAGTLNSAIENANASLMEDSGMALGKAHPNPAQDHTTIDYLLPEDASEGEIVFFDLGGREIRRFMVDPTFSSLLVSTAELPAGTYLYQLQVQGDATAAKKIVVIR